MINKNDNNDPNINNDEIDEKNKFNIENSNISSNEVNRNNNNKYYLLNHKLFNNINNTFILNINLKYYIVILLIIYFIFTFNIRGLDKSNENEEVFIVGKNRYYLNKNSISIYNKFMRTCNLGILLDKKRYPLLESPKISITIPIYNGGKYLYYSLRSIQNQKMKEIEIIFIDDNSSDDSLKVIEEFMKEDPRIKLIKNKKNRKILYSKSIAALNSNGKYIFQFDQDDILIRDDVFNLLYNEAEDNNLDLVHIRDIYRSKLYFDKRTKVNIKFRHVLPYKETHYKKQPELKDKLFADDNNYILWGLLIKTDLYKISISKLWPIVINYQLVFFEDHTITFMIVILAKKYKYLNTFGIIHLAHKQAASNDFLDNKDFYVGLLFFINTLYDYYIKNNPQDIHILIHFFVSMQFYIKRAINVHPKLFFFIIKKIYINNHLSYNEIIYLLNELKIPKDEFTKTISYHYLMNTTEYNSISSFQKSNNNEILKKTKNIKDITNTIKISIIIYFTELELLKKSIKSIQNQQFEKYEIILIYDYNEKKNLINIKKYINKFPNIKLIDNKKQKGLFYSYSIGVMKSKGDFLFFFESGDTLTKNTTLNDLYLNIVNNKLDILEFNILINRNGIFNNTGLSLYKCSHFISELDLSKIKYNKNYTELDEEKELLSNKIIKSSIYKNITNKFISTLNNKIIFNYFDDIYIFLLNKLNLKFKHTDAFGIIKYKYNKQKNKLYDILNDKIQIYIDSLFYINFLFENSENTNEGKNYVLYKFYNIMNIIYNKVSKVTDETEGIIKKFLHCEYISFEEKLNLEIYFISLIN